LPRDKNCFAAEEHETKTTIQKIYTNIEDKRYLKDKGEYALKDISISLKILLSIMVKSMLLKEYRIRVIILSLKS
jgi:hypothetical protein